MENKCKLIVANVNSLQIIYKWLLNNYKLIEYDVNILKKVVN